MKELANTEEELRNASVPWPKTIKELTEYINSLVDKEHDYGTCVYAMSMAAVATFYYVSSKIGATGFQAGCADMDILARTRHMDKGFRIVNYENLLYPQYCNDMHFPSWRALIEENKEALKLEANKLIDAHKNPDTVSPAVVAHWAWIASL
jgi:hypothetical protein